jgi:enoyl-CoA hydratase/carnithine racemase
MSSSTTLPLLLTENRGEVVHLILNRPEKRNALSLELLREFEAALEHIAQSSSTRVVVVASRGPVFCSGHDLGEMASCSEEAYRELFALCSRVMLGIRRLPQPVIARVQGMATAAGCQLAATCDLVVTSEDASFATPGVKIGLFCTTPAIPLVRAIPAKTAMEMLLTGTPISAKRACELGLVNRVVPASGLDAVVAEWTSAILASSPVTVRLGKAAFYEQLAMEESAAYKFGTDVMTANALCADAQEGIEAFLQKRRPAWKGA